MVKILAINPGSTSTKIGFFENENKLWSLNIEHDPSLFNMDTPFQKDVSMRIDFIKSTLKEKQIDLSSIDVFATRGGASKPIKGGTYLINESLIGLQEKLHPKLLHPSNLACSIGFLLAKENNKKAFFTDSPMTYEIMDIAQFSGHQDVKREARFHALNQKAMARQWAKDNNKKYEDVNLIVAHLGGGISIGAHQKGVVIDVNDGVDEGPFSPNRSGSLPVLGVIEFSKKYLPKEAKSLIQGKGGLYSYFQEIDFKKIENRIYQNDLDAKKVIDAMIYQIAHEIGARAIGLKGKVDAIILTGGIAHSQYLKQNIGQYIDWIANVCFMPGELELESLANGAYLAFTNQIEIKEI